MTTPQTPSKTEKRIRIACVTTLAALALMGFSLVYPKPLAVIVAMSVAQLLGTVSLGFFLLVVAADFRRSRILEGQGSPSVEPSPPPSSPAASSPPPP